MTDSLDDIGLKEYGSLRKKAEKTVEDMSSEKESRQDVFTELMIELDGKSELTGIDPHRLLEAAGKKEGALKQRLRQTRAEILENTGSGITRETVDSIVDATVALDILKKIIYESGGHRNALQHASKKYGVSQKEISLFREEATYSLSILGKRHETLEVARIVKSFYGPDARQSHHTVDFISRAGKILGVKNAFKKTVGFLQILYDMEGGLYPHAHCIQPAYTGKGIGRFLLGIAEKHAAKPYLWSICTTSLYHNIRNFTDRGYRGVLLKKDVNPDGEIVPRIVLYKDIKNPFSEPETEGFEKIEVFDGDKKAFKADLSDTCLLEEALNKNSFELVGIRREDGGLFGFFMENQSKKIPGFMESWGSDEDIGKGFRIIRGSESLAHTYRLTRDLKLEDVIDYRTVRMIAHIGAVIGRIEEDGNMAGFCPLVRDMNGIAHAYAVAAETEETREELLEAACRHMTEHEASSITVDVGSEDVLLKKLLEIHGFIGVGFSIDPYGDGKNHLRLEKKLFLKQKIPRIPGEAPKIMTPTDLEKEEPWIGVDCSEPLLAQKALEEGYSLVGIVGEEPARYVLTNTID